MKTNPFFLCASFFFVAFVVLDFFVFSRFFDLKNSTDLRDFFSAFPPASILFLPLAASSVKIRGEENFPVRPIFFPLPKFSCIFFACIFVSLLTVFVPLCVLFFGDLEAGSFFSGFAGIVLYFFSASNFTVMIFSLFDSAGVSFFVSAAFLAVSCSVHFLPFFFRSGAVQSAADFFSFARRFDSFSKGIFSTKDFSFFVLSGIFFYAISAFHMEKIRGNSSPYFFKIRRNFFASFFLLFLFSQNLNFKIDLTRSKKFSVSLHSKKIFSQIEDPVFITYYFSPRLKNFYPQVSGVQDFLEEYALSSKKISLSVVNPSKEKIGDALSKIGISGRTVREEKNGSENFLHLYSAIKIDCLGESEIIPFVLDSSLLEFDLTRRLKILLDEKKDFVQVVSADSADLESGYAYVEPYLQSAGFSVLKTRLPSQENSVAESFEKFPQVPLVIFGSEKFTKTDLRILEKFILNGGKVFLASQPFSVDLENDWSVSRSESNLLFQRFLFTFGIYLKDSITGDVSCGRLILTSEYDSGGTKISPKTERLNYPLWPVILPQKNCPGGMQLFWPCAFDTDDEVAAMENLEVKPILFTGEKSWQTEESDGGFLTNPFYVEKFPREKTGAVPVAAEISRKGKKPNFVFVGDRYAFSSATLSYAPQDFFDVRSFDFLCDEIFVLNGNENLLSLKNKNIFNDSLYRLDGEKFVKAECASFLISLGIPFLVILSLGFYFYFKRRAFNR